MGGVAMSPRAAASVTRLVLPGQALGPGIVVVPEHAARHARVTRVRPGDPLELLNLDGAVARATLVRWEMGACVVDVVEVVQERGEPPGPLVLALGLLHTEAFSWAVEKVTELGATHIQPVLCMRVQGPAHRVRGERWQRIAAAAVAQCGRARPPTVLDPLPLSEVCSSAVGVRLFADPECRVEGSRRDETDGGATVLVGPEGGFTPDEVQLIARAGFSSLWLGPRTLRAETAALAALALAQHHLGWLRENRHSTLPTNLEEVP